MEPTPTQSAAQTPDALQEAVQKARSLGESAEAVAAWGEILKERPGHKEALAVLASLAQGPHREEARKALADAVSAASSNQERAVLFLQLGAILESDEKTRDSAREAYEAALKEVPESAEAFFALAQLLEAAGDEERLIEAYLARIEHASPKEAVELLTFVAERFRAQNDINAAYEVLVTAMDHDVEDEHVAALLEDVATRSGRWANLIDHFAKQLNEPGAEARSIPLGNTIARWYAKLGQTDYAIAYHEFVLTRDPQNREALEHLEDLYGRTGRHGPRAETLWKLFAATESLDEKREIARKLAKVYEQDLRSPQEACRAYAAFLELDPQDEEILAALEPLYQMEGSWKQLIDVLARRAQLTSDRALAATLRRRIGELWEVELRDINRAISAYKEALDLDPQDEETRQALEELLDRTDRHRELLEILDVRLESAPEPEKLPLLRRRAELFEQKLGRLEEAAQTYERILEKAPTDELAFGALANVLSREERWGDYARAIRRRLEAPAPRELTIELLRKLGEIFDEKLDDESQAIEAYEELLGRSPDDLGALRALSRLYANTREWDRAMSTMQRLVDRVPDMQEKIELYQRLGDIAHREMGNTEQAVKLYQFAVDVDQSYLPAVRALRKIYEEREAYDEAARLLRQEEQHTKEPQEKAKILTRLGDLFAQNLGDEKRAAEAYRQALSASPRFVDAARPLADIIFSQERYAEAEPLLDILVEELKAGREEARAIGLHTLHHRLGICAEKLSKPEKALKHLRLAYEIDDQNPALLYDLAGTLYRSGEQERAFSIYQQLLSSTSAAEDEARLVEIYYHMGAIRWSQKDGPKAGEYFELALRQNPRHRPTLEALIEVRRQEERFEDVVSLQRTRVEISRDAQERFTRLVELGDLLRDKLKAPQKAISAYQEALELKPDDRSTLFQLMTLYHETGQWQRAIDAIQRIANLEKDPVKRARYHNTTAVILRDELKNPEEARAYFEKALDDDPMYEYAFDSIKAILQERGDYQELERAYRKELLRLPREGKLAWLFVKLSHDLGDIYREKLNQPQLAAEAYELAARIEPGNEKRHELLAELYTQDPERWEKAVEHHRVLLNLNANRAASYQALFKLYARGRQYDKAFCLAATLSFMRRAGQEEQSVLDRFRPKNLTRATRRIDAELWRKCVVHPEQTPQIDEVFGVAGLALAQLYARPEKELGFKRKERVDIATSDLPFAQSLSYVQQTLSVPLPEVHLRSTEEGLLLANALADKRLHPVVVVGPGFFQKKNDRELVFQLARNLVFLRPDYYLARAVNLQVPTLMAGFLAALKAGLPTIPIPKSEEVIVNRLVERLRPLLTGPQIQHLAQIGRSILEQGLDLSMSRWMECLELTTNRIAFALCGDLEVAARAIQAEALPTGNLSVKDKLKDLVLYSVSEEYFTLRASLGLQIEAH